MKQELHSLMHDARLLNVSEAVLRPLLDKKIEIQIGLICAKFEGGSTDILTDVAKLCAFRDIQRELKKIQQKGSTAMEELHGTNG